MSIIYDTFYPLYLTYIKKRRRLHGNLNCYSDIFGSPACKIQ